LVRWFIAVLSEFNLIDGYKGITFVQRKIVQCECMPHREAYPVAEFPLPPWAFKTTAEGKGAAFRILPAEQWRASGVRVLKLCLNNTQRPEEVGRGEAQLINQFGARDWGLHFGDFILFRNRLVAMQLSAEELKDKQQARRQAAADAEEEVEKTQEAGVAAGGLSAALPRLPGDLEAFIANNPSQAELYNVAKDWHRRFGFDAVKDGNKKSLRQQLQLEGADERLYLVRMRKDNLIKILRHVALLPIPAAATTFDDGTAGAAAVDVAVPHAVLTAAAAADITVDNDLGTVAPTAAVLAIVAPVAVAPVAAPPVAVACPVARPASVTPVAPAPAAASPAPAAVVAAGAVIAPTPATDTSGDRAITAAAASIRRLKIKVGELRNILKNYCIIHNLLPSKASSFAALQEHAGLVGAVAFSRLDLLDCTRLAAYLSTASSFDLEAACRSGSTSSSISSFEPEVCGYSVVAPIPIPDQPHPCRVCCSTGTDRSRGRGRSRGRRRPHRRHRRHRRWQCGSRRRHHSRCCPTRSRPCCTRTRRTRRCRCSGCLSRCSRRGRSRRSLRYACSCQISSPTSGPRQGLENAIHPDGSQHDPP
jgi:hypothetical protein